MDLLVEEGEDSRNGAWLEEDDLNDKTSSGTSLSSAASRTSLSPANSSDHYNSSPPTPPRETSDDISVLPRELQGKYHDYVAKKKKVQETGRQSNSRDACRSKVYSAEHVFQQSNPSVKKIMTESDAVTFFNNVVSSPVYKTLSKNNKPKLYIENTMTSKLLKGAQIAGCANQAYVKLARKSGGLNKYVILHELSHTCGNAHHDIKFREDQIKLVSAFMSKSLGTKLRRCYAASKLKTAVPDKIMGPTEWLASYEKITNARKK